MAGCSNTGEPEGINDDVDADWAEGFVVWSGKNYVVSKESIDENRIGDKLGDVTKYSDTEADATQNENFSNVYKEGTEYFEIKDTDTGEAIAVEDNGDYIRAENQE